MKARPLLVALALGFAGCGDDGPVLYTSADGKIVAGVRPQDIDTLISELISQRRETEA